MTYAELRIEQEQLFKNGSKTYYNASKAFPPETRLRVTRLYAFVRLADDFVDAIPQNREAFMDLRKNFETGFGLSTEVLISGPSVVNDFILLCREEGFEKDWVNAFLDAMESDLGRVHCKSFSETTRYTYGSAEVVGLMMCKVLGLDPRSFDAAMMQGRAMQIINFIRDIHEDIGLGREYLPFSEDGIEIHSEADAQNNKKIFEKSLARMISYYHDCQNKAYAGYDYIPKVFRVAVATATDMYNWTARKIMKNPMIVFKRVVKPHKLRVLSVALKNLIKIGLFNINPKEVRK